MILQNLGRRSPAALLVLAIGLSSPSLAAQEYLAAGRLPVCDVKPGETRTHSLVIDAGKWLAIEVEQRGADVVVTLRDPDGDPLLTVDSPTSSVGKERLFWVSELAGRHQIEVAVSQTVGHPACYDVLLQDVRSATESDREKAAVSLQMTRALDGSSAAERRSLFETAAESWRVLGEPKMEASARLEACSATYWATDLRDHLERVIATGDPVQRGNAQALLGKIYFDQLHDLELARENYLAAHRAWTGIHGAGQLLMKAAGYLGSIHDRLGEYAAAFEYFDEALQLSRDLDDPRWNAIFLNNRGRVHHLLAQYERAETDLARALELWREDQPQRRAATLTLASYVAAANQDFDLAWERIDRALELRGEDQRGLAVSRVALGWIHYRIGRLTEARAAYLAALEVFRQLGEKRNEALVEHKLGLLEEEVGDAAGARKRFAKALSLFREIEFLHGEAEALLGVARVERLLGQLEEARSTVEKSLDIIEELRTRPLSFHLQAVYFASKLHVFDFYIDLLMELHEARPEAGFDAEAFAASEKSRARSLLETLHESGVDPRYGADQRLLEQEAKLLRKLKTKLYQSENGAVPLAAARDESRYLRRQYDEVRRALAHDSHNGASPGEPVQLGAEQIQQRLLDEETLLLEYHLGSERSFLFVVSRDELHSFELPARREIEAAARTVKQWLDQSMQRRYRGQLQNAQTRLSDMILGPAAELLDKRRLLIVTGGVLQYLPFSALPLPGSAATGASPERLVNRHEIAYLPSASTLAALRDVLGKRREASRRLATAEIAVLADPVYNRADIESLDTDQPICGDNYRGARFLPGESGLPRLPCTRREARAIGELSRGKNLIAMDFEATRELATSPRLGEYRYLHFATHGQFDSRFPEKSSLVFSLLDPEREKRNGYLYLPDVYRLELAADLAVLSACQTALGETIRGEGLVGFTQGFMYAGVPRVLVSLWNVDDPATATLMERFYHHLLEESFSPAAALRKAQLYLLEETSWSAPYYWAGFVLQGDIL